jgi:hypothetical protein
VTAVAGLGPDGAGDFRPAKSLVETGEIERVIGEFRRFLEAAVDGEGTNRRTILEIR